MSRWFRYYTETLNDPKVQLLPGDLFKSWVNLLCLCSAQNGKPFDCASVAFALRVSDQKAQAIINDLLARNLLDDTENGVIPHNWRGRQYKSDVSNDRVKQHRKRKRNVTSPVTATPPDTDTEQISEANASDAGASAVERLWSEGLPALLALGVKEPQARPMIGRWRKDTGDDCERVLTAILRAREVCPADPIPWINASLKDRSHAKTSTVIAAADKLVERIRDLDKPAGDLRSREGAVVVGLLPQRGRQ